MAALYKNIVCENRSKLEEVIPLDGPYTVAIDPSNLCNFKCNFCAIQGKDEKLPFKKQLMPLELFKKIIDDLKAFPQQLKVLRINGQGEPLLNPHICEMIRYAKESDVADYIEMITNGSKLNPTLNRDLIDSGIDRIRISVEALDEAGYKDIAETKLDFKKFIDNIRDLHEISGECEIYCKIVDVAVPTENDKARFFELFGEICDRMFIDSVIPMWSDFEELNAVTTKIEKGVHGQQIKDVLVCPYSFYSLIINSDGEVTACCADWKRKLVLGDLNKESLQEIWQGDKLRTFWIQMLKGNKNRYEMCSKCLLPMYDCNDDIDEFTEMILERLEK